MDHNKKQDKNPHDGQNGGADGIIKSLLRRWVVRICQVAVVIILSALISLYTGSNHSNTAKYTGYSVLSVNVKGGKEHIFKEIVQQMEVDVWTETFTLGEGVLVGVAKDVLETAQRELQTAGLEWTVHIDNLQTVIDAEQKAIADRSPPAAVSGKFPYKYDNYNTYSQTQEELKRLADHCPHGFKCDLFSIGHSYEGNELTVLHISKRSTSNKAIWLDSLIHCREWIAGATLMNFVRRMLTGYGQDATVTKLMDNYDWYFLPIMNPDGYIYTWTDERLWRQNRQPNEGSTCMGTDLNRNFEYMWGGAGSSPDPCNNEYRGAHAASAPETRHVQRIIEQIGHRVLAWVSFHSCWQGWLIPWAFTEESDPDKCAYASDYSDLFAVADKATKALNETNGKNFTAGNWCEVMYNSSGVLQDHVKAVGRVKYAYTLELRKGETCFIVDPEEIIPSANEVYNGLVAMVEAIEDLQQKEQRVWSKAKDV